MSFKHLFWYYYIWYHFIWLLCHRTIFISKYQSEEMIIYTSFNFNGNCFGLTCVGWFLLIWFSSRLFPSFSGLLIIFIGKKLGFPSTYELCLINDSHGKYWYICDYPNLVLDLQQVIFIPMVILISFYNSSCPLITSCLRHNNTTLLVPHNNFLSMLQVSTSWFTSGRVTSIDESISDSLSQMLLSSAPPKSSVCWTWEKLLSFFMFFVIRHLFTLMINLTSLVQYSIFWIIIFTFRWWMHWCIGLP